MRYYKISIGIFEGEPTVRNKKRPINIVCSEVVDEKEIHTRLKILIPPWRESFLPNWLSVTERSKTFISDGNWGYRITEVFVKKEDY